MVKINLLKYIEQNDKYKYLIEEWDQILNGNMTNYTFGTHSNVSWICRFNNHHKWTCVLKDRVNKESTCPLCMNRLLCPIDQCNSVYYSHPNLREEWDTEKNGDMKQFFLGHKGIVSWRCKFDNHHIWDCVLKSRTTLSAGCSICASIKICQVDFCNSVFITHPHLIDEWDTEKNGDMKQFFGESENKFSWICKKNPLHKWKCKLLSRTNNSGCPDCKNKTEDKLYQYLLEKYINVTHNFKAGWCKNLNKNAYLIFDFILDKYNIIIELDGAQHFRQISNWASPENSRKRDIYKMYTANQKGYTIIRLLQEDVISDKNNWKNKLVENIKKYETPICIYLTDTNIYDQHKKDMKKFNINNPDHQNF